MLRSASLAIGLFLLWLALSGFYDVPLLVGLGIASSLLVVFIAHRMDLADHEGHPIHLGSGAVTFWPWLAWEIIKANIDVARIILSPKMPISPVIFKVRASQLTEVGQVTYANSITLTPGTVTVDVEGEEFTVHAITREAAAELKNGRMDRRTCRMEGTESIKAEVGA
ncbi:MAG: Na+/H+ antiporter subunit E [Rhodospirillales bacterium]|nr:Na+/H+ antiporter subunit E [Rhodospirillales bacterium]